MAEDISNKTLATLLVLSIVVSLAGALIFLSQDGEYGITGHQAFTKAKARINISARAALNWTTDFLDFGTGYVSEGFPHCVMDTNSTSGFSNDDDPENCTSFNNVSGQPLVLENTGNRPLEVNVSSDVNATQFLNSSEARFEWLIIQTESLGSFHACQNDTGGNDNTGLQNYNSSFNPVNTTPDTIICERMRFPKFFDELTFHILVDVPSDALPGERNATFTAEGTVNV